MDEALTSYLIRKFIDYAFLEFENILKNININKNITYMFFVSTIIITFGYIVFISNRLTHKNKIVKAKSVIIEDDDFQNTNLSFRKISQINDPSYSNENIPVESETNFSFEKSMNDLHKRSKFHIKRYTREEMLKERNNIMKGKYGVWFLNYLDSFDFTNNNLLDSKKDAEFIHRFRYLSQGERGFILSYMKQIRLQYHPENVISKTLQNSWAKEWNLLSFAKV